MLRIEGDRRRHPRVELDRPCKIHDPRCGRYISAAMRNLSAGGLMLDVPRLLEIEPGERIHVGVAMKRRQGLVLTREMIPAVVVRTMATVDDHTAVAVSFDRAQAEAISETQIIQAAA